ncbi:hypothetical protein B0H66DRAFT_243527 [Apodospora peruviana]|uniref:Uncharacterized protein n=1 Tax=Apodospora peruviana TaxID=516989 RepID=A0AAE0I5I4_9PEZI|nr:hypothetical protein B0H66DRAFT_243527 [Apodospora peruviana]
MAAWFPKLLSATSSSGFRPADNIRGELPQCIPESFTLSDLLVGAAEVVSISNQTSSKKTPIQHHVVLAILVCLRDASDRIRKQEGKSGNDQDSAALRELALLVAKAIAPVDEDNTTNSGDDDIITTQDEEDRHRQLVLRYWIVAEPGIKALELITKMSVTADANVLDNEEVLLTLISFASSSRGTEEDAALPEVAEQAAAILSEQLPSGSRMRDRFIVDVVLQNYLRRLFSKSKPSSITASGRKAAYSDGNDDGRQSGLPDDSKETKPWKFTDHRAISVVAWAVDEADEQLISKHWPLFIPVLLTLVDDNTTSVRRRGLVILTKFLAKFPDKTLHDTGLAQVFEEAVFPTLSYLPSLTPENDSVQLLVPAFEALRCLARKQSTAAAKSGVTAGKEKENMMLGKVLREGVFPAYFHAKDHVRIVEVLCQQTGLIIGQMGIHAVKHLKDLIPMLSAIMTDPFAPLSPATLLSATKALQATLANCWPRIATAPSSSSPWRDEIINALILCWLNEHDHETSHPAAADRTIKRELIVSASALAAVLKSVGIDAAELVAPLLMTKDSEQQPVAAVLAPLFSISAAAGGCRD